MKANKVVFGAVAIMDISDSTVTPETLGEGVTAYDKTGEKIIGSMKKGVELPELGDTAAQPTDMAASKVLYDDDGNPVTGTLYENIGTLVFTYGNVNDTLFLNSAGGTNIALQGVYRPDKIGDNTVGTILRPGALVGIRDIAAEKFGNATADQVAKGATFTSAAGLLAEGTMEPASASSTVVQIAEATPSANSLTLTFTGLSGEPTLFSINPKENITQGSTRYILGVDYDGDATMGVTGYTSGSWGSSATAAYSATNFTWEYSDGTLTVTSAGATTGGYFMNGITYQLTYITDTLVQGETGGTGGSGGTDTSDATATENDILSGKTAYAKGVKVTGKIQSQAAQTITPGTKDQTIASGKYLSGTQTIKGDSNLKAENIKKGVSIFGVSGSLEESSGTQLPDDAIVIKIVKGEEKSTQVGSGYSLSISYADAVEINDSIALAFVGTAKNLSGISDTTDFSVLLGKYIRSGTTTTNYKYYYIPDDATFTYSGSGMSKSLTCDKAQAVSVQKVSI